MKGMITVKPYEDSCRNEWNLFLESSRTPVFLFSRNYMEYHKDRFPDYSLCIYDDGELAGLFPACIKGNALYSHAGLTFGGLILSKKVYGKDTLRYLSAMFQYCDAQNLPTIYWKQSPSFYSYSTQEDTEYALFLAEARLTRIDTAFCIDQRLATAIPYQERRMRAVKKALKQGVLIEEASDFGPFWTEILEPNLQLRFGVKPVHSLEEIRRLADANPGHIRQFTAKLEGKLVAGCTIFEGPLVAHAQYISASDVGRQQGGIDLLFHELISNTFQSKSFFDFGIANENEGRTYNTGLMDWKEGFGARAFAHRFYEVKTANFPLIDKAITGIS